MNDDDLIHADLAKFLNMKSEGISLLSLENIGEELHRLLDNTRNALVELLAFANKTGLELNDPYILPVALYSTLRDSNRKRSIKTHIDGKLIEVDFDQLNAVVSSRRQLAESLEVSENVLLRFEQSQSSPYGMHVQVKCNHPECITNKHIPFHDPAAMLKAESQASGEIWFCPNHRELAFKQTGTISDELVPVLTRIHQSPGLTQKDTKAKRSDLNFLSKMGLIAIEKLTNRDRLLCYNISLTEAGIQNLAATRSSSTT